MVFDEVEVMLVICKLHGFLTPDLDSCPPSFIDAWISFELGISLKGVFQISAGWLVN